MSITPPKLSYLFSVTQLQLPENENLVKENYLNKTETLLYEYLYPKKYKLKLIEDSNSDNKWTTGDILKKIQPEKTLYNSEPINVRSNWDLELEWNIKD